MMLQTVLSVRVLERRRYVELWLTPPLSSNKEQNFAIVVITVRPLRAVSINDALQYNLWLYLGLNNLKFLQK